MSQFDLLSTSVRQPDSGVSPTSSLQHETSQTTLDTFSIHCTFVLCVFLYIFLITYFLTELSLCCCTQAFSTCSNQVLFIAVYRLLSAEASPVAEYRKWCTYASIVAPHGLQSTGSVVVAHRLSCSKSCGIFPDQGSNLCPLHW